jgi:hypothetical protein
MTTIATNPPATRQQRSAASLLKRAPRLLTRAMFFLGIGAIVSILLAWALGLWADPDSATVISATIPQRGRTWEISLWSTSGAMRLHSQRHAQSWGGWQATGPPDSTLNGDSGYAWCPATADGQPEWLILDYSQRVTPKELHVYENYCPGGVNRVTVFSDSGDEIEAWRGQDPTPANSGGGISKIPLNVSIKTQRVKVYIDSKNAPGWNEIDAVGLLDDKGSTQWASDVQDSSSYANLNTVAPAVSFGEIVPSWCPLAKPDTTAPQKPDNGSTTDHVFEARGWPMLALWTRRPDNYLAAPAAPSGAFITGRLVSRTVAPGALPPILPSRPIWGGLLFDTVFFAVILGVGHWMLVKPRRLVLELRRMRSGCCIACGYELDFDFRAGCPECGWRRTQL